MNDFEHFGEEIVARKNQLIISGPNFRNGNKEALGKVYIYDLLPAVKVNEIIVSDKISA